MSANNEIYQLYEKTTLVSEINSARIDDLAIQNACQKTQWCQIRTAREWRVVAAGSHRKGWQDDFEEDLRDGSPRMAETRVQKAYRQMMNKFYVVGSKTLRQRSYRKNRRTI